MATQALINQKFCDCGRAIEKDPATGKALANDSSKPICLRCKSLGRAWRMSRANPDNNKPGKRAASPIERCSKAQPWATWAVTL